MGERTELKACPFCGGKAEPDTDDLGAHGIRCMDCTIYLGAYSTARRAAEVWNRRASAAVGADKCRCTGFYGVKPMGDKLVCQRCEKLADTMANSPAPAPATSPADNGGSMDHGEFITYPRPASAPAEEKCRNDLRARIIRNVCELPNYTSPDDQPDLLTCTVDELDACIERALDHVYGELK